MQKQSLNREWRFLHSQQAPNRRQPQDDTTWRVLDLPHDWSIELSRGPEMPSGVSNGWFEMGRGQYHKIIDAPEEWRGKKVFVEFEGVYMNAEIFLNEHYITRHPYGYTTFLIDLTPYLKFGEQNVLKVNVDNAAQTNSRWYSGSGIYRPVWLIVAEPVHIAHWGVTVTTPQVSAEKATVHARVKVQNEGEEAKDVTVRFRVLGPDGTEKVAEEVWASVPAGGEQTVERDFTDLPDPALWSPESPNLYRLETTISADGKELDSDSTTFGIRSIEFSAEKGFLLNGQPVLMKGGCVHHDNGVIGSASYARSEERKVEIHKASGYNAIRTAHNPPSPAFLDACDRLGMLVMDESFDCWVQGKNPYDYHVAFSDWWQRDTAAMVERDRNHPSVVIWSIGNEVAERDGRSGGAQIARRQAEYVRQLDPTRPVASAINGVHGDGHTWEDTDAVFSQLGVGGYNYQWQQYQADHERHPNRIMAGTESFPLEALENWQCVEDMPWVIGDFVWTSLDYLGESGIGRVYPGPEQRWTLGEYPWHQAFCGDLDLCGFKRPQSYYRDQVWGVGEKLYVAVHQPYNDDLERHITRWGWPEVSANWNWAGHEGQTFKVDVYSRCDEVELFLNGRSLGKQPAGRANHLTATFEVPYEPGELKAVGYENGAQAAEYALRTTGEPARLHLSPDRATLNGADDLCFVTVEIHDENGRIVPTAENNVLFSIKGPGTLLAVGSGNPQTEESYIGSQRKAFEGKLLAVVKATGPGEIRLRAQADEIDGAETVIKVR